MEDNGEIFHSGSDTTMKKILYIIKLSILTYIQSIIIFFLIFELMYPYSVLYLAFIIFTIPLYCEYILIPLLKKKFGGNDDT